MATTTTFSEQFSVTSTRGALGSTDTLVTVALKQQLPDERMFSRVYVNKYGIVTGGVYAESVGLPDDPEFGGRQGMRIPAGTVDQRPVNARAIIRYNTDDDAFEFNEGGVWVRPCQYTNLLTLETDILPRLQGTYLYQVNLGSAAKPFQSGTFNRVRVVSKASLSDEDRAPGVLANLNGVLYWGGEAVGASSGGGTFDPTNIISNLVPAANLIYDIGSSTKRWSTVHVGTAISFGSAPADLTDAHALWLDSLNSLRIGTARIITDVNFASFAPTASAGTKGLVRVGSGLAIDGDGILSYAGTPYTLPVASATILGGVKIGSGLQLEVDGTISVASPGNPILNQVATAQDAGFWISGNILSGANLTATSSASSAIIACNNGSLVDVDYSVILASLNASIPTGSYFTSVISSAVSGTGTASWTAFIGGAANTLNGTIAHSIVGGSSHTLNGSISKTLISGDSHVVTGGTSSTILGNANTVTSADYVLVGGSGNTVSSSYSFIAGGSNTASSSTYAVIGGMSNNVTSASRGIAFGARNTITSAADSGIFSGADNLVSGTFSTYSAVIAGKDNKIYVGRSAILGGNNNTIQATGERNIILGGQLNTINSTASGSAIIACYSSTIGESNSVALAGQSSSVTGPYSLAVGSNHSVAGNYNAAFGHNNTTTADAASSVVFGVGNTSGYYGQAIFGYYNVNSADSLLEIGAGTSDVARSTVFRVTTTGTMFAHAAVVDYIDFNTAATAPAHSTGRMHWNAVDQTMDLDLDGGSILQIGQELLVRALNNTGAAILNGKAVYVTGAQGNRPTIALASASADLSSRVVGVATQDVANNAIGFFTVKGLVHDLDTSAFAEGADIWLSTTAGGFVTSRPAAPNASVYIGTVVRSHATVGQIFVNVNRGFKLGDLGNVSIASPQNSQVLTYTDGVWGNATVPVAANMVTTDTVQTITGGKTFTSATTLSRVTISSDQPSNVSLLRGRPSSGSTNANLLIDLYSAWDGTNYTGPAMYFGRSNGNGWFTSTSGSFFFSGVGSTGTAENMYFGAYSSATVSAAQCSIVIEADTQKVFLGGLLTSASTRKTQASGGLYVADSGIEIASATPSSTTSALYNVSGQLYWNGAAVQTKTTVDSSAPSANVSMTSAWINRYSKMSPTTTINVVVEPGIATVGDKITVAQGNTTLFTLTAGSGVTLNCATAQASITPRAQHSVLNLICVASNVFDVYGDFTP